MLLRLRVSGFKNLRDVEVRFGPLTCFVGPNGVGKSNIFDAIQFLRALADTDIQTAAQAVRSPISGSFGPRDLFWNADPNVEMSFEVDMLVPQRVVDEFGRDAEPATTLLRYEVALRYVDAKLPRLELTRESLKPLKHGEAKEIVGFPHRPAFAKSALKPSSRKGAFISTRVEDAGTTLLLHQDGGSRGQPIPAGKSPRTVLGGTNASEYPTVLAAHREMASWQALHLEPSVMRTPDPFGTPGHVNEHGGHVAATLNDLVTQETVPGRTLSEASNRLAALVPEVKSLSIDRDEVRQQLSILAKMTGCKHALGARSLSDGTLRFLALVTMQLDANSAGVLCMEEPENGINPAKVPAMIELLRDFAVDPDQAIGPDNPLRQVILNTHSPDVIRQLDPYEVLFVEAAEGPEGRSARVGAIEGEWRRDGTLIPPGRMWDFVGGAPLGPSMRGKQQTLRFGTAS